jgi:hypothetical protein
MFYSHGGGFVIGSGAAAGQDESPTSTTNSISQLKTELKAI